MGRAHRIRAGVNQSRGIVGTGGQGRVQVPVAVGIRVSRPRLLPSRALLWRARPPQKPLYGGVIGGKKSKVLHTGMAFGIRRAPGAHLVSVARTNSRPLATRHLVCANHTDPQKNPPHPHRC